MITPLIVVTGCYDWTIEPVGDADGDADGDGDVDSDGDMCECREGPCCDGCHFWGIETRCDDEAVSADEQRCGSDECGADVLRRGIYRHCSGVSAECPTNMLREGDWEVFQDCSDDEVCVFAGGAALCHSCVEGCEEGHCTEPQCDSGPCCEDSHFASSTTRCSETAESRECRCTSGECGADVECRSRHRYCTGMSEECTTEHLEWEDWSLDRECSGGQVCLSSGESGECQDCEVGCEDGECVERECTTGPCCDGAFFRPSSHECSTETEYRCDGTGCGADAQERTVTQRCSGTSSGCDGAVTNGVWTTVEACTTDQVCVATSTEASCRDCAEGCTDGACDTTASGTWVTIEAGTFMMGSPGGELGRYGDEEQHEVTLTRDYEIQTTEVTQEQFEEVMRYNPSYFDTCGSECPVEDVNWYEAAAYCNELSADAGLECYDCTGSGESVECEPSDLFATPYDCPGYRLPTEAEWEYAARAGDDRATYNGELDVEGCEASTTLDPIAWYCGNSGDETHEVGTRDANAWGLYDMLGNVWEWCHDWYGYYPGGSMTDPWGPGAGSHRVERGGSWGLYAWHARAAHRGRHTPGYSYEALGLRVSRSLP